MKKLYCLVLYIICCFYSHAQIKFDFYDERRTSFLRYQLGDYLEPIFGKLDSSYHYYVSLTSPDSTSLNIEISGKESKVRTAVLNFFKKNKDFIKKPKKGERILIPIYVLDPDFDKTKPIFTEDISRLETYYDASAPGYVYFVRPVRVVLKASMQY
jgi:hypothetical protein